MNRKKMLAILGVLSIFGLCLLVAIFAKSDLFIGLSGIFLFIFFLIMIFWFPKGQIVHKK